MSLQQDLLPQQIIMQATFLSSCTHVIWTSEQSNRLKVENIIWGAECHAIRTEYSIMIVGFNIICYIGLADEKKIIMHLICLL